MATTCTEDGHKQTTKTTLQYKPKGRRNVGWPRNRWRDQLHLEDQKTGITPQPSWTSWWWWWYCLPYQSVKTNTLKAKDLNLNMRVRMWRFRDWNRAIHTFRLQRTNEWTRWTPPTRSDWPIYYRRSLAATSEKGPILWPSSSEGRLFDFCWWENIAQYIKPVHAACLQTKYKISDLLQHISFCVQAKMVSADVFWYSRFKRNDTTLNIQATHIWYYISMYTKLTFRFHRNV